MPPLPAAGLPYAAYLRVYEPLAAFAEPDRGRWAAAARRAAEVGPVAARLEGLAAERRTALAGVISLPPRPVPPQEGGEAFVLDVGGVPHVCPVQTRLRSWVALGQLRETFPEQVLHAFLPPAVLERADADHARWAGAAGSRAVDEPMRIRTATWSVPLPWFVPFAPADRVGADPAGRPAAGIPAVGTAVLHRTRMSAARRRVARALRTLTRYLAENAEDATEQGVELVAEEVETLARWLEEFHARSWLELDYAGLTALLPADDTSVADVAAAVAALAAGDEEAAVLAYSDVVERWAAVAALQHAS